MTEYERVNKWRKAHRKEARYIRYRSDAKTFARHYATKNDMKAIADAFNANNK